MEALPDHGREAYLMSGLLAPISCGELVDKITILEIKLVKIVDAAKRRNIEHELLALRAVWIDHFGEGFGSVVDLAHELKCVNTKLWEIEDDIRSCERAADFGDAFVALARAVYFTNDARAALKRKIDVALGSALREEKSYESYAAP